MTDGPPRCYRRGNAWGGTVGKKILEIRTNWRTFWRKAKAAVHAQAGRDADGAEKMKGAIDDLVEWGDKELKWGKGPLGRLAEWADGLVLRAIATVLIQAAHDVMKEDGEPI